MSARTPGARPGPGQQRPYRFPRFESSQLPNGVRVLVVPVARLPLVSMRIVMDSGARAEGSAQAGIASLAALGLAEGTARLDAAALAVEFETLGGALSCYAGWDATQVATTVLAGKFERAAQLLGEVIRFPAYPAREVERLRNERLAELLELRTEPRGLADERFNSFLFKTGSRFSLPEGGSEATVATLDDGTCRDWHSRHFVPAAMTVIVCGDVERDRAVAAVEDALGSWTGSLPPPALVDDAPAAAGRATKLVHRDGAPQSELRIGHVSLKRNHPDYFDVVVMNAILGGVFNSRINLNLRERHAYTYGAFSAFEWRRDAGTFAVSTAVATAVTAAAIGEILLEVDRMRAAPPTPEELSLVTSYLAGVFPIRFETTEAISGALASMAIQRLPEDYFDTYRDRIRGVTAEGVERVAREHLNVDGLQVLALGDRNEIASSLQDLGIGPMTVEE